MNHLRGSEKRKRGSTAPNQESLPEANIDTKRAKRYESEMDDSFNELNSVLTNEDFAPKIGPFCMKKHHFYFDRNPAKMTRLYHAYKDGIEEPIVVKRQPATSINMREIEVFRAFQISPYCPIYYGDIIEEGDIYFGMERLYLDVWDVQHKLRDNRFAIDTACRIILQGLTAIEHLHGVGYVHSDIKPSNFMLKDVHSNEDTIIRLIDFGLSRPWHFMDDGQQGSQVEVLEPKYVGSITGTPRYASARVHELYEPSRVDDLISLFYAFYEMIYDNLPWVGFENDPSKYGLMYLSKKDWYPLKDLAGQIDPVMVDWVEYVSNLKYNVIPDYEYLKNCFRQILNQGATEVYDWIEENTFQN